MHYKDGTEAKVGDLVKGTCYNTKNADGTPKIIVGTMLGITPGSTACNCRVLIATAEQPKAELPAGIHSVNTSEGWRGVFLEYAPGSMQAKQFLIGAKVDYSQCDHLELVHRPE